MDGQRPPEVGCAFILLSLVGAFGGYFGVFIIIGSLTQAGTNGHRRDNLGIGIGAALVPLLFLGILLLIAHRNQLPRSMLRWPTVVMVVGCLLGVLAPNHMEPIIRSITQFFGNL